ncbi:imidazole glycerol phosphate synthase subunit HisH [Kangiella marina]|uniref:Imidazole glycerol phosphate synthase subunit HisH n=1 Tax=Kangiella marina TaxID=1079178 RepID=A0ABP8INK3_9GAMM
MSSALGIKKVGVVNTKAGNLFSLFACLRRIGFEPITVNTTQDLELNELCALVIPGQGRFGQVMKQLKATKLDQAIQMWSQQGKPLLGICVGLQVMFEQSDEDPGVEGLALFEGKVTRLQSPKQPMVGWCQLDSQEARFKNQIVYFVNSYGVKSSPVAVATVTYGEEFVAAINQGNLWAFQFHPEKSGPIGEEMIKQCLR